MNPRSPGWRLVHFVQHLIDWVAPPLHSLHWKILALLLVGLFLPALFFLWQVSRSIEHSHLVSTEQGMIDTALVVADALSHENPDFLGSLPRAHEIRRRVFRDESPDLRIVIYDAHGRVLSDTEEALPPGTSHAERRDIRAALAGRYGARWEPDRTRDVVNLYSAVPVFQDARIIGVVSVVKPTSEVIRSVSHSLKNLLAPALLALAIACGISYLLSSYLTRVIKGMASRAGRIASGEPGVTLETWTRSELGDLARALEAMRRKLEGKAYIEEMASTLSHELKTPLSSIRGATEIIDESDSPEVRAKFVANIRAETDRLTHIVDNLLALSRIETRPATADASSHLKEAAESVARDFLPRAEMLGIDFRTAITPGDTAIPIDSDSLRQILGILLDNAFAFTPRGKSVSLETSTTTATVRDEGGGIPLDLQSRVFERFFTTVNPLTGRRGTGLGLAIAHSLVTRAGGTLTLSSTPGQGTTVTATFPPLRA